MNPQSGFSRLKAVGKRSFSDFVRLNQGRVGSKNALALSSLVGGSVLMELFSLELRTRRIVITVNGRMQAPVGTLVAP